MTEVRDVSSAQHGLFATRAYSEGDVILAESPLAVLSRGAARSQFKPSSLRGDGAGKGEKAKSLGAGDLVLPKSALAELDGMEDARRSAGKVRGMVLALASIAAGPPSDETKSTLLGLYHPSLKDDENDDEGNRAVGLARLALKCAREMAAPDGSLSSLLEKDDETLARLLLVYSCNAFEGGRVYERISRANHSCDPNAVVVEGDGEDDNVLKAACDISPGDEICISYLGKYLFAGYPIRQRLLRANKHFVCRCSRCGDSKSVGDLASRVPCPVCHTRTGRYLDEDVMFDDPNDEDGLRVCYAAPRNGMAPEERALHCTSCGSTTAVVPDGEGGSMRKKKEGLAVKYMCMAEEKVFDRLEGGGQGDGGGEKKKQKASGHGEEDAEREIDEQFLQMATGICGAQHWTTHFLTLSMIEESLASFHSTLMAMGQDPEKDAETMEDLFVEIAEVTDGIEKAYAFASSLELKLNPAHWLFDYTVGLARTLVGLGDEKSQKYGSTWIKKVEKHARFFENDGMNKVVVALRDAWQRGEGEGKDAKGASEKGGEQGDSKRRKIA